MEGFIGHLVGLIVWLVANVVYADTRRRDRRGFLRFVSFWMGLPATFVVMIVVREGSQPDMVPPPDDEEALLDEIRRARLAAPPDSHPDSVEET